MQTPDLLSLVAKVIDEVVPFVLLIASVATLTGNYLAKRFFDACGLRLRARYGLAVAMAMIALALFVGLQASHASTVMIAALLVLSALAFRTGSRSNSASMAVIATLLLIAENTA